MVTLAVLDRRRELLLVHRSALLARARTSNVCHVGHRREVGLPPDAMQPVRQVHLLVVHEEGAIESADRVERRLAECERSPSYPRYGPGVLVGVARQVQLAQAG